MLLVKPKNLDKFRRYVSDLLFYLKKTIDAKYKKKVLYALKKYREMDKTEYLELTLKSLEPFIDQLARSDEIIFTPEYQKSKKIRYLNFIPGFDFSLLWRQNLNLEQKNIIFRYLLYLYLQASTALSCNRNKVKEIVESLKTIEELEREAEANPNMDDEGGLSNLKDIFGEDSLLMDIATELTEEFNFQDTLKDIMTEMQTSSTSSGAPSDDGNNPPGVPPGNPMEMMNKLLQSKKLQETMNNMQTKMQSKVAEKELTQEDLMKSMSTLQENLGNQLAKMVPGGGAQLKKMMKNINFEQMLQGMAQQQQLAQQQQQQGANWTAPSTSASTPPPASTSTSTSTPTSAPAPASMPMPPAEGFNNFMNMMMDQGIMKQMKQAQENMSDEMREELKNDPSKLHEHICQMLNQGAESEKKPSDDSK